MPAGVAEREEDVSEGVAECEALVSPESCWWPRLRSGSSSISLDIQHRHLITY